MTIAAKHFDPVIGVDVHIVQPPPPAPPLPIPHPHIGFLIDPFDYVPVVGSTISVNGLPRATAGTSGKCLPPHIPLGGSFIKLPVANESEMFMGSQTVTFEGEPASHLSSPSASCQCIGSPPYPRAKKKSQTKSFVLPTSVVLPIPGGPPVTIGGPPTISAMGIAAKFGFAALGKAMKKLAKSKVVARLRKSFREARQKMFKNMKPGFLKCKVLHAEPVNITTGEVTVDQQDFSIPGRIPLEWNRHYGSHSSYKGVCGYGWETPADARLELDEDGIVSFHDGGPGATIFESLPDETAKVMELCDGAVLARTEEVLTVQTKAGLVYRFPDFERDERVVLIDRVSDLCGNYLKYVRDRNGLKEIRESAGRCIEVTSQNGRIYEMEFRHPDYKYSHPLVKFDYNSHGDLIAVYDALDHAYRFDYNDHRLIQHTDRNGLSFYYEYDSDQPNAKCIHAWGDGGLYNYHFEYELIPGEIRITDSLGSVVTLILNANGIPIREVDAMGGTTEYEYDDTGRTIAVVDPSGNRTSYEHDDRGNSTAITLPNGARLSSVFTETNLPTIATDACGNSWNYYWTDKGKLGKIHSPKGGEWLSHYTDAGDMCRSVSPAGGVTVYKHDKFGQIVETCDPNGGVSTSKVNAFGCIYEQTDPINRTFRIEYDSKMRVTRLTDPLSNSVSYQYDCNDNLTSFQDANGNITRFGYEGLNQLASVIYPDGSIILYKHDTEDRLIEVINELGETYSLERDPLGRICVETDFYGGQTKLTYDVAGNVETICDPLGRIIKMSYDKVGQVTERMASISEKELFVYDPNGNIIELKNSSVLINREFDEEGNLIREAQGDVEVQNEFDLVGNRTRRVTREHCVEFVYGLCDELLQIVIDNNPVVEASYDKAGQLIKESLAGQLEREIIWDQLGRIKSSFLSKRSSPIVVRQFDYDSVSNLLTRSHRRIVGSQSQVHFAYDSRGRLTEFATAGFSRKHHPDQAGEVLTQKGQTSRNDRIAEFQQQEYLFDQAGFLVRRTIGVKTTLFQWDSFGRLRRAVNQNGDVATYEYDPTGRRVSKEVNGAKQVFAWDKDVLLCEQVGESWNEFVFRPETFEPLASSYGGSIFFYELDSVGLPHELVSELGTVEWSATYDEFGATSTIHSGQVPNPLRFAGQYYDEETGLSYSRYRYFDSTHGSFVSIDPIGLAGGTQLYSYGPNPWAWIDPLGLMSCDLKRGAIKNLQRKINHIQHHLIPVSVAAIPDLEKFFEKAAKQGWDINGKLNGMNLHKKRHKGGHPRYTDYVANRIRSYIKRAGRENSDKLAERRYLEGLSKDMEKWLSDTSGDINELFFWVTLY